VWLPWEREMKDWIKKIEAFNPCPGAGEWVEWCEQFPDLQQAWDACERGDWMLWLLGELAAHAIYATRAIYAAYITDAIADVDVDECSPDNVQKNILRKCAEIVRKHYPQAPKW